MKDTCPCCGAVWHAGDPLVAACDVLVVRALELVGKRVVRVDRSRFSRLGDQPWHQAHTLWQADPGHVEKGLAEAWYGIDAVLSEHGCCGLNAEQLTVLLDRYVRDLIATQTGHDVSELRWRMSAYLGVPVQS